MRLKGTLTTDRKQVAIEFFSASGDAGRVEFTQEELLEAIQDLGKLHAVMCEGKILPNLEGQRINATFDTRWLVQPQLIGEAAALSFYHRFFGPLGFLIPVGQLPDFIRPLQALVDAKTQERNVTKN